MPVYNNILVLKILGMRNIEILTCWSENQLWSLLRGAESRLIEPLADICYYEKDFVN